MISERRLVALVPARGGSKGIPRKNLYKIGGATLLERAIKIGRDCRFVDQTLVSTDDPEMYAIAKELGCATPNIRPARLATDTARTVDVIRNLVDEGTLKSQDCLALLQPTSPIRTAKQLSEICEILEKNWAQADAVISVCEMDGSAYKAQTIQDGYLRSLMGQDSSVPRQSLPKTYIPNGAFYLIKIEALLRENTFVPLKTMPFQMSGLESINLDGPMDLLLLEAAIAKGWVQ